MSQGSWRRDRWTGISKTLVAQFDEVHLDDEGYVDISPWPDADLFDVRSIAAEAGFNDHRYFLDKVLGHPDSPFHVYVLEFHGHTDRLIATTIATHTNSAQEGRNIWRARKHAEASKRGKTSQVSQVLSITTLTCPNNCSRDTTLC